MKFDSQSMRLDFTYAGDRINTWLQCFSAYKHVVGRGGGISVSKSTRYFKTKLVIKFSGSRSDEGFNIELIDLAMQHLVADV